MALSSSIPRVVEERFERVAGVVGQSFEYGPEEGSAPHVRAEADERTPRCGIVVRRVCEAQVRQEEGAEGPWRDFLSLGDQGVVVDPAKGLSQPFDAGSRSVLAAEDVVLARHVGSLGVTLVPDLGVRERALERQEDRLCCTERVEHRALLRDAGGKGAADVIVASGRDAGALRQPRRGGGVRGHGTEERAAASEGGEEIRGDTHLLEQLAGPPQPVQVEGQGAGGQGVIRGGDAAQTERHVVGHVQPGGGARVGVRLVLLEPEQLAQAEDGLQREARQAEETVLSDDAAQPLGLGPRPSVEPGDDVVGGLAAGVERYGGLTHAGDGYARHAAGIFELLGDLAQGRR